MFSRGAFLVLEQGPNVVFSLGCLERCKDLVLNLGLELQSLGYEVHVESAEDFPELDALKEFLPCFRSSGVRWMWYVYQAPAVRCVQEPRLGTRRRRPT